MWGLSSPNLCLHVYTPDGRHIDVNYTTGVYEVEIEDASASGDLFEGTEWISVPDNVEAFFVVSSHDTAEFLKTPASGQLENENGLYIIRISYTDEQGNYYSSPVVAQAIEPGAEVCHDFDVTQNPDGTYFVEVAEGMNLLSLEAWCAAVDNIPNELFIRPSRFEHLGRLERPYRSECLENRWAELRKQELKLKFRTVFRILEENRFESIIERLGFDNRAKAWIEYLRYRLAIWKLEHDILEKLDGDGRADWTSEPVLVDEVKAFIGYLKNRAPPRPSSWVERYIDREAEGLLRWFEVDR